MMWSRRVKRVNPKETTLSYQLQVEMDQFVFFISFIYRLWRPTFFFFSIVYNNCFRSFSKVLFILINFVRFLTE